MASRSYGGGYPPPWYSLDKAQQSYPSLPTRSDLRNTGVLFWPRFPAMPSVTQRSRPASRFAIAGDYFLLL